MTLVYLQLTAYKEQLDIYNIHINKAESNIQQEVGPRGKVGVTFCI